MPQLYKGLDLNILQIFQQKVNFTYDIIDCKGDYPRIVGLLAKNVI